MLLFVRIQDRHLDDRWLFPVIIQASKQVDSDNNHAEKSRAVEMQNPTNWVAQHPQKPIKTNCKISCEVLDESDQA